jgi:hypothetical protein
VRPDQTGWEISLTSLKYATDFSPSSLICGKERMWRVERRETYFPQNLEISRSFQTHVLAAKIYEVITTK